ncbi:O-antigen ligase [Chelatococcus caeni]|uniref:O-antigen ligase n=1 Tax=Chelatococcus caeni TaxID=1348468 RepID=A0A840BXP3_9HYPH|nr:O-antigen ligase family protein [Chelatococcus caeni]MBB4015546.1 O-antigen ligase [Chelatococcus caeni]
MPLAMPALSAAPSVHARRLELASLVMLALLPLAMALANRSAPLVVGVAAVLALLAALAEPQGRMRLFLASRAMARAPAFLAVSAFVAYAAASMAWSVLPRASLFTFGEALLPAFAAAVAAILLPRRVPGAVTALAAAAFVVACLLVVGDLATGLAVRQELGLRATGGFVFNRSIITLLMLAWPLGLLWCEGGRRLFAGAALAALLLVLAVGESGAALMGALCGAGVFAVALLSRRVAIALVTAGLLACLVVAPFKGSLTMQLPASFVAVVQQRGHAVERIALWRSFEEVVWRRPLLGTGFGASPRLADDAVAQEVPEDLREMLAIGHPHDAFLQIWVELGAVGAALAALVIATMMRALAHLQGLRLAASLALVASAAGVMLVGHGAWQGWWIAAVGAAVVWFRRRPDRAVPSKGVDHE